MFGVITFSVIINCTNENTLPQLAIQLKFQPQKPLVFEYAEKNRQNACFILYAETHANTLKSFPI